VAGLSFPALLIERQLVSPEALSAAESHATREDMELVDALVGLCLLPELDAYSVLAEAAGASHVVLDDAMSSEFAIRLVPECLARRHLAVPLDVEHRTLTYATCCPFRAEAERDLS
jgi:type IV pilus assembly protein PilB